MNLNQQLLDPTNSNLVDLFEELWDSGVAYARRLLQDCSDCEEFVQEAFCRLANNSKQADLLNDKRQFTAVFFKTIRNLSIDELRRRNRRRQASLDQVPEPVSPMEHGLESSETLVKIETALSRLPEEWQEALHLKISEDLTYSEISDVMDCTIAQVRTWIFRARRRLKNDLRSLLSPEYDD